MPLACGFRFALFGLASRFLKFVRSRAFRNSVNANATRGREVPPQTDSDAISHLYNRILGGNQSLRNLGRPSYVNFLVFHVSGEASTIGQF